jgi:ubiquinone/menaquinone biosynthesis C-methylase UbiE
MSRLLGVFPNLITEGLKATKELLRMCHLNEEKYVLDVGCGAGITPSYISKKFGCRVVGVDFSEKMLSLAKERAKRGKAEKLEFKKADAPGLPFEEGTFDLVISQSIVSFVQDKESAIKEYARVVKPHGYVGINEAIWLTDSPPSDLNAYVRCISGAELKNAGQWRKLFDDSDIKEVEIRIYKTSALKQYRDEVVYIGLGDYLKGWAKFVSMLFIQPEFRGYMKNIWPSRRLLKIFFNHIGYGLFVGRKPE